MGDLRTLPGLARFFAFALRTRQVHGIWGGLTEQERHQVTKPATERRLRQRTSPLALTAVAVHMGPPMEARR